MPGHWWMDLGFVPVVGRTVSGCVFKGNWGLGKTLGNLSANGWGSNPALLAVWPEVFHHWNL